MERKLNFQRTLAYRTDFENFNRLSKRERFLDKMNEVVLLAFTLGHGCTNDLCR